MAVTTLIKSESPRTLVARYAWVVLGYFVLVVLWGAVVRATGSGGGCGSNWPLCNGDFFPHHPRLATIIEFTHRSTSGVCTFLIASLAFWTFRRTTPGHRARKAVLWSGFFLITEALLGAALVINHWVENQLSTGRVIAQSIHFTNTLLLMGAMALTAWFLRESEAPQSAIGSKSLAITAIVSTLIVGATGSLAALADTLFPSKSLTAALQADFAAGAPVLIRMRWLHPAAAMIALVAVIMLVRSQRNLSRSAHGLSAANIVAALLLIQFVLGGLDVLLLAPTWMQVLHLLGADLYWIALTVLAGRSIWQGSSGASVRRQTA